jgi:hypothetical protein
MKTANTASSTMTMRVCTRSMNFAPAMLTMATAMLTMATAITTAIVSTLLQAVESSKNSADRSCRRTRTPWRSQ